MKKIGGLLLSVALAASMFAGCSSSNDGSVGKTSDKPSNSNDANKQVTIKVLSSDDFAGFREKAIKEFEQENPNIHVNLEHVAYDQLHDKELASFNASDNAAYDVVDVDEIWTTEYAKAGFIIPVTDRYTDEMKKGILPASLNIVTYNGGYYGIPMFNDALFFYYNEDMLKKAGYDHPPKTWTEFTEMSNKLQQEKITQGPASAWGWSANEGLVCYYTQFLGSFGGKYLDNNGAPVLNNEKGIQALQYMSDAIKQGIVDKASISMNDRQILDAFKNGKTAFVSGWSFYWGEINADDSKVKGQAKVGLVPVADGAEPNTVTGSMFLGITPQSKQPDAAWKFIEFLASKKIQKEQSLDAGALPIWKDLYDDQELNKNHGAFKEMGAQLEHAMSRPQIDNYNEFSKDLQIRIQQVLTGQADAKSALNESADVLKKLEQNK